MVALAITSTSCRRLCHSCPFVHYFADILLTDSFSLYTVSSRNGINETKRLPKIVISGGDQRSYPNFRPIAIFSPGNKKLSVPCDYGRVSQAGCVPLGRVQRLVARLLGAACTGRNWPCFQPFPIVLNIVYHLNPNPTEFSLYRAIFNYKSEKYQAKRYAYIIFNHTLRD